MSGIVTREMLVYRCKCECFSVTVFGIWILVPVSAQIIPSRGIPVSCGTPTPFPRTLPMVQITNVTSRDVLPYRYLLTFRDLQLVPNLLITDHKTTAWEQVFMGESPVHAWAGWHGISVPYLHTFLISCLTELIFDFKLSKFYFLIANPA